MSDVSDAAPGSVPRPRHRIFFAVFPDAAARDDVVARRQSFAQRLGLQGRLSASERLHVTLIHVGDFAERPEAEIDRFVRAAAAIDLPPVTIAFDRVSSFRGRPGHRPCILLGHPTGTAAVCALQSRLHQALVREGWRPKGHEAFTPHLTLLYSDAPVADEGFGPVSWVANEFVLVDSLIGQGRYEVLARWPLRGAAAPQADVADTP